MRSFHVAHENRVAREVEQRRLLAERLLAGVGARDLPHERGDEERAEKRQHHRAHRAVNGELAPRGERGRCVPRRHDAERKVLYVGEAPEYVPTVDRARCRGGAVRRLDFLLRNALEGLVPLRELPPDAVRGVRPARKQHAVVAVESDRVSRAELDRVIDFLESRELQQRIRPPGIELAREDQHRAAVEKDEAPRLRRHQLRRQRIGAVDEGTSPVGYVDRAERQARPELREGLGCLLDARAPGVRLEPGLGIAQYRLGCLQAAGSLRGQCSCEVTELAVDCRERLTVGAPDVERRRRRESKDQDNAADYNAAPQERAAGDALIGVIDGRAHRVEQIGAAEWFREQSARAQLARGGAGVREPGAKLARDGDDGSSRIGPLHGADYPPAGLPRHIEINDDGGDVAGIRGRCGTPVVRRTPPTSAIR